MWFARQFPAYTPNSLLLDNALATMGAGLPSAIAAKIVRPSHLVLAVVGDGGYMMASHVRAAPFGAPARLSPGCLQAAAAIPDSKSYARVWRDSKSWCSPAARLPQAAAGSPDSTVCA